MVVDLLMQKLKCHPVKTTVSYLKKVSQCQMSDAFPNLSHSSVFLISLKHRIYYPEASAHRENQSAEAAAINTVCKPRRPARGFFVFGICATAPHKTFPKRTLQSWQLHPFCKGFVRLTGAIPKQSNSTAQIWPPPWLNLRRKQELDLLPLELHFLYASAPSLRLWCRGFTAPKPVVNSVSQRRKEQRGRRISSVW